MKSLEEVLNFYFENSLFKEKLFWKLKGTFLLSYLWHIYHIYVHLKISSLSLIQIFFYVYKLIFERFFNKSTLIAIDSYLYVPKVNNRVRQWPISSTAAFPIFFLSTDCDVQPWACLGGAYGSFQRPLSSGSTVWYCIWS